MKSQLAELVQGALKQLQETGQITQDQKFNIVIEHTRNKDFGDFACNIAMMLSKQLKRAPREIAQEIIDALPEEKDKILEKVEIAGPGFINFYLQDTALHPVIEQILNQGTQFGRASHDNQENINLEFVSANPTGPLHVGHGRGAAYGASCASLLEAAGYKIHREYYVNDAGRQMDILATSVWLRYLEASGEELNFPSNGYRGDYIQDLAQALIEADNKKYLHPIHAVFANVPEDLHPDGYGDKEAHIDGLIHNAKTLLGDADYQHIHQYALNSILSDIRQDLSEFGVIFDEWLSEKSLFDGRQVDKYVNELKAKNHTYEKDGHIWFRSTEFGDDKDRVLIRKNGQATYFAADIANHMHKFERGADKIFVTFGADHHGYVARVRGALEALGIPKEKVHIPLYQFATLYRGKEKVQMSTRSGSFITLRDLREEVGSDAARFFYIMRKAEQHFDFDLELAKSHSTDNPVYYIQYAHARICSIFRQLAEKGWRYDQALGLANYQLLSNEHEKALVNNLAKYEECLQHAAINFEPHMLAHYLRDLANSLHTYYNAHQFLVEDEKSRNARLCLIAATKQVIANGLHCLGVSAPEEM